MKHFTVFLATSALLGLCSRSEAVIALNAPTTVDNFVKLDLGGPSDPVADNQANRVDIELVGDEDKNLGAFYLGYDSNDQSMTFRVRVSGENGNADGTQDGYTYIGLDVTGDGGLDYWIEHGGTPSQAISLRYATGLSDSPDNVALGAVATYAGGASASTAVSYFDGTNGNSYFEKVETIDTGLPDSYYDLDEGGKKGDEDRFLTFHFDFNVLQQVVRQDAAALSLKNEYIDFSMFDDTFAMQMLLVTSQNSNNINSDLGGIDDNSVDGSIPFVDQPTPDGGTGGGLTGGVDSSGNPTDFVPEPTTYALLLGLLTLGFTAVRRRR